MSELSPEAVVLARGLSDVQLVTPAEADKLIKQSHQRATVLGSERSRLKFNECVSIIKEQTQKPREPVFVPPNKRVNPYNNKKRK
jgi:hypothetical protein